jgi:ribonuclease T1
LATGFATAIAGLSGAATRPCCTQLAPQRDGGLISLSKLSNLSKLGTTLALVAGGLVSVLAGIAIPETVFARESASATIESIPLSGLPKQAQDTYQLVFSGGPFPYPKDGVVFGNRERQLPRKVRGFYHEYTVKTPASRDRGARRIVCGGELKTQPEVCYYTDNHYATFSRIAP